MPSALVFIKTETGFENDVLKALKRIPSIQAAHVINGSYNLSAKVNYESMDKLKEIISITRVIDGVNICEVELF